MVAREGGEPVPKERDKTCSAREEGLQKEPRRLKRDAKKDSKFGKKATRWQRKCVRINAVVVHEKELRGGVNRKRKIDFKSVNVNFERDMFALRKERR